MMCRKSRRDLALRPVPPPTLARSPLACSELKENKKNKGEEPHFLILYVSYPAQVGDGAIMAYLDHNLHQCKIPGFLQLCRSVIGALCHLAHDRTPCLSVCLCLSLPSINAAQVVAVFIYSSTLC